MASKQGKYFRNQNYDEIKRECLSKNELWEDPEFPAVDSSMFFSKAPPRKFEWKRPGEIVSDPHLFVAGATRFDVEQGMLGDCWLLAAIASLSMQEKLMYRVIQPDQSFSKDYAGIVYFQFWRFGEWVTVCVDDRLPTYNGRLVFVHSKENNEFWSALLEKAYAKMHGSYEALKGGQTTEAMEDFTGGCAETFQTSKAPENFFKVCQTGMARSSLLGCSINAKPNEIEARLDNGLIKGHAYSITDLKQLTVNTRRGRVPVSLVRVRNPWGNEREWTGAWGDGSDEWGFLSEEEKTELGLVFEDDGEFWMQWEDFLREFTTVDIVMLTPDSAGDKNGKEWETSSSQLRWRKGVSAGGCRNFPATFHLNPQVKLVLEDPDDDEDDLCTVVIAVMQKDRRRQKELGKGMLTIGFAIYKVEDDSDEKPPLSKDYFLYHASTARSHTFINAREINGRFKLPQGEYVVVPSTFDPNEEGDFLVRIFSEKRSTAEGVDETTRVIDVSPEARAPMSAEEKQQQDRFTLFFNKVAGNDNEVDAWELRDVLTAALRSDLKDGQGLSVEACKSMVAFYDDDMTGKLGVQEFMDLFQDVRSWKDVFKNYDKDGSGSFDACELRAALRSVGYSLSSKALISLVLRFAEKDGKIDLDNFIHCAIKLKGMFKAFQAHDETGSQITRFGIDDFIETTMYS